MHPSMVFKKILHIYYFFVGFAQQPEIVSVHIGIVFVPSSTNYHLNIVRVAIHNEKYINKAV